jgi:hypothetical protein
VHKTAMPVLSGFLAVALASSVTLAGEPSDLQKQIDDLKAKVQKLENKQDSAPASGEAKPSWADRITLFGDFRYRHEIIEKPDADTQYHERDRDRIRLRLGLDAKVNDEVNVYVRLATDESDKGAPANGGDPTSTNQTLTNFFTKKNILLDQAYFNYHPADVSGLNVLGGKMDVPWIRVGGQELLWDGDLTPEGMAFKYAPKLDDGVQLLASGGAFWVSEREGKTDYHGDNREADAGLFGAQAALKLDLAEKGEAYVLAGAGYFTFTNTESYAVYDFKGGTNSYGNTKNAANGYRYGYNEAEYFAEIGFPIPVLEVPCSVYADYVNNSDAAPSHQDAYLVGATVGKLKDQWSWTMKYNYREVQKDAVLGAFCDSDSNGGGTDQKGHKAQVELMILKNTWISGTYFQDKMNIAKEDTTNADKTYRRWQLDLNFKF